MKITNKVRVLSILSTLSFQYARAFTTGHSRVPTTPIGRLNPSAMPSAMVAGLSSLRTVKSTALSMIFDKLFSTSSGRSRKIDYSTLPFPGLELATLAIEGQAPEEITHNGKVYKLATFAGGCFWSVELAFQRVPGVAYTCVGYTQGEEQFPTYDDVCFGATKHTEAVCVLYDPKECTYTDLLDTFFSKVNPTTVNGQGNDFGPQYRTGVYYHSTEQENAATLRFKLEQEKYSPRKIASECMKAKPFWPAEKYHQQYLEKGGRFGMAQSAAKNCKDPIRCYG